MPDRTALISIHPHHVSRILSGEKKIEFRRVWAARPVETLILYSTTPVQRIVGFAHVSNVFYGSVEQLWALAQEKGGCISHEDLAAYLEGRAVGAAIELEDVRSIEDGRDPRDLFGPGFRPPQSYRYLKPNELAVIRGLIE